MGTVNAGAAMSLDGFVADPSGEVGPLFDWYFNGDVEFPTVGGRWVFKTSEPSAEHLREIWNSAGALVVGRGEFDKTQAWGGLHPLGVPVFVLTHRPPAEWPFPQTPPTEEAPFTFVTDGIESAIAQAQTVAGDKVVGINPGSIAGQALDAGLLDEVWVDLVPVLLGDGIRFFGDVAKPPVSFTDPRVIEGNAVTHLIYRIRRDA
jgi:dihydrofolate reductase